MTWLAGFFTFIFWFTWWVPLCFAIFCIEIVEFVRSTSWFLANPSVRQFFHTAHFHLTIAVANVMYDVPCAQHTMCVSILFVKWNTTKWNCFCNCTNVYRCFPWNKILFDKEKNNQANIYTAKSRTEFLTSCANDTQTHVHTSSRQYTNTNTNTTELSSSVNRLLCTKNQPTKIVAFQTQNKR